MSKKYPSLAKAFGVATLCAAGLAACGNHSADVNLSITLLSNADLMGTVEFNRQVVRAQGFNPAHKGQGTPAPSVVTYDVLEHKLCHSDLTGDDHAAPVCHSDSDFDKFQREGIRDIICNVAQKKRDKAYMQLFCGPQPKQV